MAYTVKKYGQYGDGRNMNVRMYSVTFSKRQMKDSPCEVGGRDQPKNQKAGDAYWRGGGRWRT